MTTQDFISNNSFTAWSMKHLSIDENEQGDVLVHVPDKCGAWFRVTCQESKTNITPTSCSCGHDHCKHIQVVTAFYSKFYKQATPVVTAVTAEVPQIEDLSTGNRPISAQEWRQIKKRNDAWQRRQKDADWALIERARKLSKARAS